ncbi:hypothetical protein [Providencia rettgeri]|uniref:hypothetical protein n=1 Tax=Providencia rettgeri TaxID=587 RepID=UPI00029C4B40|nr:hypothetical protein [Providencia rettgeri]EKT56448.1 hypothetical protein OOC_09426 [Providencia rettgeri Dmel1]
MSPDQFHDRMWEILQDINKNEFHAVAAKPPTDKAIANLATSTGIALPKDFLAFSQKTNALCIMAREELWPEAKLFDVGPAWTFHRGLVILGIEAEDLPEWANIQNAYESLVELYELTDVLPLLKIMGDGNHYWGVKQDGTFVEVFDGETTTLECSFIDTYATEIKELIQRQKDMCELITKRNKKQH